MYVSIFDRSVLSIKYTKDTLELRRRRRKPINRFKVFQRWIASLRPVAQMIKKCLPTFVSAFLVHLVYLRDYSLSKAAL